MKTLNKVILLLTLLLLTMSVANTSTIVTAQHDEHESTEDECHDPTTTLMISTVAGTDLKFDKTELNAPKGACVMIMFKNLQAVPHDFSLDHKNGTQWAHLHLDDSEDNSSGTPGQLMVHLQMPDEDVTLDFYCSVSGHRAAGMEGKFIIGEGSSEDDDSSFIPGFGLYTTIFGLTGLLVIVTRLRKKN